MTALRNAMILAGIILSFAASGVVGYPRYVNLQPATGGAVAPVASGFDGAH